MKLNYIPFVGWLLNLFFKISLSVPFWFFWNIFGLGKQYFYFLPERFQVIPFWDGVGLFVVIPIILHIITPRFVTVSQSVENKKESENTKLEEK